MQTTSRKNLMDRVNESGAIISGIALLLMMLIGALDVFLGKVFNMPIPGTFEATEALMVVSAFLAIAYNQQVKGHIKVELFTSRFSPRVQAIFELFAYCLSVFFFFLVAWQAWLYGWASLKVREYESGLIAFPVYPAKLLLALGVSIMTVQCLKDIGTAFKKIYHPDVNKEEPKSS